MPKKRKCWSFAAGEKGCTVTVYERKPGGLLYARTFDRTLARGKGGYRRVSLNHRDQERAKTYALEQSAKLRQGHADLTEGKLSLARLFALYASHRTPRKSAGERSEDGRRIVLFTRVFSAQKDPHLLSLGEWENFIEARLSGAITGQGVEVPVGKWQPIRNRTVEADCLWLRQVLNWATRWRDGKSGHYLMRENPVRGYDVPVEKNPRRPVATTERYDKLRAVSDLIVMEIRWSGHRVQKRSYLSELLDLAYGTGRRINAICQLRYEDLQLDIEPFGAIRWPEDTDKMRSETVAPISRQVRKAIDRILAERPGIGAAFLFPSPIDQGKSIRYELAAEWLRKAEKFARLPKQSGSLFHAFRRGWVTSRKHLPDVDVAAAGGWKDVSTLKKCYQQPDMDTMLAVVEGGRELRERRA